MTTLYHRTPWLERLIGMPIVWITEPQQLWLPHVSAFAILDAHDRVVKRVGEALEAQ